MAQIAQLANRLGRQIRLPLAAACITFGLLSGVPLASAKHYKLPKQNGKPVNIPADPCVPLTAGTRSHMAMLARLKAQDANRVNQPPATVLGMFQRLQGKTDPPDEDLTKKIEDETRVVDSYTSFLKTFNCKPIDPPAPPSPPAARAN